MRMVRTNVLDMDRSLHDSIETGCGKYFAVSSDKAANPANAMGATKRLMELCLIRASGKVSVSSARFANVAFSDGSLLFGFDHRLAKRQPIAAPEDVRRYFISAREAAILCLFGCLLGENRESVFPRPQGDFRPLTFRAIAERYLRGRGLEPHPCASETEARARVEELAARGRWPCFFFSSDTTGEKMLEEFVMAGEEVDANRYREIGVIRWRGGEDTSALDRTLSRLRALRESGEWTRDDILLELKSLLPELEHRESGKFLDSRM
jgi:FlaA1/EpsC-like NDP-sugar epimerase